MNTLLHLGQPLVWVGVACIVACSDSPDTTAKDEGSVPLDTKQDKNDLADGGGNKPELVVGPTIAQAPEDPLEGSKVESCPIYLDERCSNGSKQRCDIYNAQAKTWDDDPDPTLRRVYLYDRWYDRYSSPDGQTAERIYTKEMPADAPEETWSAPATFSHFVGAGDSAIWTGAALSSDIFRYVQTGTQADYQRMEDKVRTLLLKFEVTNITGYLARYHGLWVPPGAPHTDQHILRHEETFTAGSRDHVIEKLDIEGLPTVYTDGLPAGGGEKIKGIPRWNGHPSIDQYTGPMLTFPLVYNLLDDESLKARIVKHMTCYLKRLRRMELTNLQSNPELLDAIAQYFGSTSLKLDPDDIDILKTDTVVIYYHASFNEKNKDDFDRTCPDKVALEPVRVIDAASPAFLIDMLLLAAELGDDKNPLEGQIDHAYIPNIRGGDASHMMHLAAMAYYFTGEEQYREFLVDELIGKLKAPEVALTMQAFRLPPWCYKYYGDHITYGPLWQFITMLGDGPLKKTMQQAMEEELWQKATKSHHDAKFNVMYASAVPAEMATGRQAAIDSVAQQLKSFGGYGDNKDTPRRSYTLPVAEVLSQLPPSIEVRCPTEKERQECEAGGSIFGVELPTVTITFACEDQPGECPMVDGLCTHGIASQGLPSNLRAYSDFMWQRSPFQLGDSHSSQGRVQSPGRDLTEAYWMARHYGFVKEGVGRVLAWRDMGTCE